MTTTEVRKTGNSPGDPVEPLERPSRRWNWALIVGAFAAFAGTLGYVKGNEVQANTPTWSIGVRWEMPCRTSPAGSCPT